MIPTFSDLHNNHARMSDSVSTYVVSETALLEACYSGSDVMRLACAEVN